MLRVVFSQISGVNYFETFAPTATLTSVRVLMQLSVQHDLFIHQLDVKTAYLNAPIDNNINIKYLPTASMVADCLTKPIGRVKLQFCNTVLFGK